MTSQINIAGSYKNGSLITDEVFTCSIDIAGTLFLLLTIVINSLHSAIIHRLRRQNKNVCTQLLLLMSIHDIGLAAFTLCWRTCLFHGLEVQSHCGYMVMRSLWHMTGVMRYIILAMACYDRFVAICQPYKYSGNRVLNNVTLSLLGTFLLILVPDTPLLSLQTCQKSANQELLELVRFIFQSLWVTTSLVVIISTIALVLRELRRMYKRSERAQPVPDHTTIRATYLILATGAAFICCLTPILCTELYLMVVNPETLLASQVHQGALLVFDSNPIFNTVICAVMNKAYQREVRSICRCVSRTRRRNTRQVSVAPAQD